MVFRQARLDQRRAPLLAGGIARVARGLAFGLERHFPGDGLFLFAFQLCCGLRRSLSLAGYLLGLGGLARQSGLCPLGGLGFALGLPLPDRGIVETRFGSELVQDVLPGFLCRLLSVCEAGFLESTH